MNKYIFLPIIALGILSACNDDKGTYDYTPLNEVSFDDIDESYNAIQYITEIEIDPTVKGDIYGEDLSNYEYSWHICNTPTGSQIHNHRVISTDRVLKWTVDEPVGNYTLYFTVKDKATGLERHTYTNLRVASPFSRGFMILGTEDGSDIARMDMLSMPASGDTIMIEDALTNDGDIRKPTGIFYSGAAPMPSMSYREQLWIFGENDSWKLNSDPTNGKEEFEPLGTFASLTLADNAYGYVNEHLLAAGTCRIPGQTAGQGTMYYITENCVYGPQGFYGTPYFGAPVNRMTSNSPSTPLFKFYPKVFHTMNAYSFNAYSMHCFLYDADEDIFVRINTGFSAAEYCTYLVQNGREWNWDCRAEYMKLVYGDNTSTPGKGDCIFLMKNTRNNTFAVYTLQPASSAYSNTHTKFKFDVDPAVAVDLDKAEHYSFIGCRRSIFYSVGSMLHQYDFERNLHQQMDLGDAITMIKPDMYSSSNRHNDIMVATWSDANKGTFLKLKIGDNPNNLAMDIRNDVTDANNVAIPEYIEKWPTRLKVVDVEWRSR